MNTAKVLAIAMAAAIAASFIGVVIGLVKPATFWLVTIFAAVTAYKIIPKLKERK